MAYRISSHWVTNTLADMTQRQVDTLALFQHHKKWSAPLLAMKERIDLSTAHRRLNPLVDLGLLDRQRTGYRDTGGRFPDLVYLTPDGAAVLNRALHEGKHLIKAPRVDNAISNEHDLLVLEMAIRLNRWYQLKHRQKQTLYLQPRSNSGRSQYAPIQELCLVPDLYLYEVSVRSEVYFEIEQTVRYKHILAKYQVYRQVCDHHKRETRHCYLWVIFRDARQETALWPDHSKAMTEAGVNDKRVSFAHMERIRRDAIHDLEQMWKYL